jgi:hypothetical protein
VDKSELTGKDGQPFHPSQIEPTTRDVARAVVDLLREAQIEGREGGHAVANPGKPGSADIYRFDPGAGKIEAA